MQETAIGPSFTRGEYWLLEAAVEHWLPLCWLDSQLHVEILNKQGHELERPSLLQALEDLFQAELIEAILHGYDDHDDAVAIQLTRDAIEAALCEDQDPEVGWHSYRLTARGGQAWEDFAHPHWDRFLQTNYGMTSSPKTIRTGSIAGADQRILEQYLKGLHYIGVVVELDSVSWEEQRPYQATYWKVLPSGYEATFQYVWEQTKGWDAMPATYWWLYERKWYNWR